MNAKIIERCVRLSFQALLCVVMLAACAGELHAQAEVRLGFISDFSGRSGEWGVSSRLGAQAGLAAFNQRSKVGCLIDFEDHRGDTKLAISAAQKLLLVKDLDVIFSEYTPTTIALASQVEKQGKLLVYVGAAQSVRERYSRAFRSFVDYAAGCEALAGYLSKQDLSPVGFLKPNAEFGELCLEGAQRTGVPLHSLDYNPGDELAVHTALLRKKGVKSVINVGVWPDLLSSLNAAKRLHWNVVFGGGVELFRPQMLEHFADYAKEAVAFGLAVPDSAVVAEKPREAAVVEAYLTSYTHIPQICSALVQCRPGEVQCLFNQLEKSPPNHETGFLGWVKRDARWNQTLKKWEGGRERQIP